MPTSIADGELRKRILLGSVVYGIFFGLMPPYVLTIVVVSTWGMPPLEPPNEQTFRAVYLLRLVLGNVVGLLAGAFLTAGAVDFALRLAGKATYPRAILGGAVLGPIVGGLTAASTPIFLLISSTDTVWAIEMIKRSLAVGATMGLTNGIAAAVVIVYFVRRAESK
jgi:hypothetical protein